MGHLLNLLTFMVVLIILIGTSLIAQLVKNPPAMQKTLVQFLGRSAGEGIGYPLQYSCLENPMDRGAWWAKVHVVTNSWIPLSEYT